MISFTYNGIISVGILKSSIYRDILPANVLAQLGIAEFGYVLENIDQSELLGYSQDPIFKYVVTGCNRR